MVDKKDRLIFNLQLQPFHVSSKWSDHLYAKMDSTVTMSFKVKKKLLVKTSDCKVYKNADAEIIPDVPQHTNFTLTNLLHLKVAS